MSIHSTGADTAMGTVTFDSMNGFSGVKSAPAKWYGQIRIDPISGLITHSEWVYNPNVYDGHTHSDQTNDTADDKEAPADKS